jgi:molybdopterin converting factor small subunit
MTTEVRVKLPTHLRNLAKVTGEIRLAVEDPPTQRALLDALEREYPQLRGTVRDRATGARRAFVRFFACEEDLSNTAPDTELPAQVLSGAEPFLIIGAMAGG